MIYLPLKKKNRFLVFAPQAVLLAVISMFFLSSATQGFLKSWSYQVIDFLAPERMELEKSHNQLAMFARIRDLEAENKTLGKLLGKSADKNLISFEVSFGGGYLFLDTLFLNEGEGLTRAGDWVLKDGIFLGKINETGDGWAKFKSIGSLGERSTLRAGIAKDIIFEAEGIGGGELVAELPVSLTLNVGDTIWWGESPQYLAGFVDEVRVRETNPAAEVIIFMPIKIERLSEVEVLIL